MGKTIEARYQKLTQIEHVLKRPDTYVGSLQLENSQQWVWDSVESRMAFKTISYSPGLFKIFDEILVNAADVKARQENEKGRVVQKISNIKIDIDEDTGVIRVMNDGDGIPVEIHREHKIYVPELIFGHLLTSDNYDDTENRVTGGRNGYGAKLTNILSKRFTVECADRERGKKLTCTWRNNMGSKEEPVIKPYTGKDFVRITFEPDYKRFGIDKLSSDIVSLFQKRVYDIAGTTQVKTFLNGRELGIKKFLDYCNLYFPAPPSSSTESGDIYATKSETSISDDSDDMYREKSSKKKSNSSRNSPKANDSYIDPRTGLKVVKIHEKVGRWEILVAQSESGALQQVSFVNNICTIKGGTHVKYVTDQLLDPIMKKVNAKNKGGMAATSNMASSHLWIFVNCLLVNPSFEGQTKERLKSDPKTFGSTYKVSDKVIKAVLSSPILEAIFLWVQTKQAVDVNRKMNAQSKKSSRIQGIPKLEDANDAGGRHSRLCTLIITEGDSAKTSCVAGLSVVGRDRYGVFPLRGKVLNVREAKHEVLVNNVEIKNIMQILGLKMGDLNQKVDGLRYGKLMIMTDQDPDGSHIKGLLINLLQVFWPGLVKSNQFLCEFVTPIVKCFKGRETVSFFTNTEYRSWKRENNDGQGWKIKYYKGLGTSTDNEFKSYFSDLNRHICKFRYIDEIDFNEVDKAFSSKLADVRKTWISESNIDTDYIDHSNEYVTYRDFINKDLVHFSRYDVERSVASVVDGLKPGMRKCIYAAIRKKLFKNEIRITQLCGNVLELAAYHHSEASLQETIIKLAQRFVGSNNISLFEPVGQFGSRKEGGKDCSAPRYINTRLSHCSRFIISDADEAILNIQMEDGYIIEPEYYVPILPMVLVNGTEGIGTGWSSSIPQYNPRDLIASCRKWLRGDPLDPLTPWYEGFKGVIRSTDKGFESVGILEVKREPTPDEPWGVVTVSELPIKFWTQAFKDLLESMMADNREEMPSNLTDANNAPRAKAKAKGTAKSKATAKGKAKAKAAGVVRFKSKHIVIEDYRDNSSHVDVYFEIVLDKNNFDKARELGFLEEFKLVRPISVSNMVLFAADGKIKKYDSELDIIRDFCVVRFEYYVRRKKYQVAKMEMELMIVSNKAKFVISVCEGSLIVSRKKKALLVEELNNLGYLTMAKIDATFKQKVNEINRKNAEKIEEVIVQGSDEEAGIENDENAEVSSGIRVTDYDYLLNMTISTLTLEKYEFLLKEVDDKTHELEILKMTKESDMWNYDLDALEEAMLWQEKVDAKDYAELMKFQPKRTSIKVSNHQAKKLRKTPAKGGFDTTTKSTTGGGKKTLRKKKKTSKSDETDIESEFNFGDSTDSLASSPVRKTMAKKEKKESKVIKSEPSSPTPKVGMSLADRLAAMKRMQASNTTKPVSQVEDVFAKLDLEDSFDFDSPARSKKSGRSSSPGTQDEFLKEMSLLNAVSSITNSKRKKDTNTEEHNRTVKRQRTATGSSVTNVKSQKSVDDLSEESWIVSSEASDAGTDKYVASVSEKSDESLFEIESD